MQAFADHGELKGDEVTGTRRRGPAGDRRGSRRSASPTTTSSQVLEDEGVEKFDTSWSELVETVQGALDGAKANGLGERMTSPLAARANPLRDPHDRRTATDRRTLRPGDLRRHRRPVDQEADAGGVRPRQPRSAAARLRAGRVRPAGLGAPGLRQDRARRGPAARPDAVPRRGVAAAVGGHPVRAGRDRRRRVVRRAARTPSPSWTRPAAPAATTPSTCPSRPACSRPWSTSSARTVWPSSIRAGGAGW